MKTYLSLALCALLVSVSLAQEQKPDKLEKRKAQAPVYQKKQVSRDGAHHHHHDHAPAAPAYNAPPAAPVYNAPPAAPAYSQPAPAYAPPAAPAYSAPAPAPAPYAAPAPAAPAYQAPAAPAYEQPTAYAAPAEPAPAAYAAPQAPAYETAPAAPVYNAPANQGYYYYYYPVKAGKGKGEKLPKLPKASLSLKSMWDGLKTHATDLYQSLPSFGQISAYAKKDEETTLLGLGIASIVLLIISFFLLISVPLVDPNNFGNFNLLKPINLAGIGLPNISFNKFNLQGLLGRSASMHLSDYFNHETLNTFASYVLNALDEVEAKQAASQ